MLQSRDMPTGYGSTQPRPHFQILRWKMRDMAASQQLLPPQEQLTVVAEPPLSEKMGDGMPPWNDSPDIDAPAPKDQSGLRAALKKSAAPSINKKGVQKISARR
jgi:hypothetical protein